MDTPDMAFLPIWAPNGLFTPPSIRPAHVRSRTRADLRQISLNHDHGPGKGIGGQIPLQPLVKPYQAVPTVEANFWKNSSAIFLAAPLTRRCPSWASLPPI